MITKYSRPLTLQDALILLEQPNTTPMGGGTWLNLKRDETFEVVDLQAIGLNKIEKTGSTLEIGACVSLQDLLDSQDCPVPLQQALRQQAGMNIRNAATVAGSLVTCDGRSPFATVMLSLDAKLATIQSKNVSNRTLGEFLPLRPKMLITKISIPLNVRTSFESVARSPMDKPIVCASVTRWASGRTRLALGGWANAPFLVMDGTESDGLELAARNAYKEAGDEWATSEYRSDVASLISKRCLNSVSN